MTDIGQPNNLEQNINLDAGQGIQTEDIPDDDPETGISASHETLTPKEKAIRNLKQKTKELVNEEEVINELLTNPTILGKRKWANRKEIANVCYLNIDGSDYDHLNDQILDMYNNGMKDEYLETTDKYMMECVADYLSKMENIHKKYIEYYIRSIRASKLPEDEDYICANYNQLASIIGNEYNNYDLSIKISVLFNDLYRVSSYWVDNKIQHTPQNKNLLFMSVIYNFLSNCNQDLSDFNRIYQKFDLKSDFRNCNLKTDDIDEFLALWDELGIPRQYIKESIASKILAGKLALYLDKVLDCPVCMETNVKCVPINWVCGHYICVDCHNDIVEQKKCPICRFEFNL